MLLCYITDRSQFPGDEAMRRVALLEKIAEAANSGVDFIQLREKDLSTRELLALAKEAIRAIRDADSPTRLLINSRTDVAIAADADGVHLRSDDISPKDVRTIWSHSVHPKANGLVTVACHTLNEVILAAENAADFALFAPVFEKHVPEDRKIAETVPTGIAALEQACSQKIPIIALGGITSENAVSCVDAGAAGIAGIRIFQQNNLANLVQQLKR